MKILVINLLRLGDFLQAAPVVAGLQKRYPSAQIDLLTFKPVKALSSMMPISGQWWTIDREELQAGLGQGDIPLLTSFDVLKELMDRLDNESYQLVVNLTHTIFAGCLAGYLRTPEKTGLTIEAGGRNRFHSPWFRYLDANAQVKNPDIFNYTDIFAQACGVNLAKQAWPLACTERGLQEFEGLSLKGDRTLVCQVFTSDEKKNWPVDKWVDMLFRVQAKHPKWNFVLLGSPVERERLAEMQKRLPFAQSAILSLDGALALLQKSDVLVSGDTSIKHLANASSVRVVELSLGSSDPNRTGIYKDDALILQAQVPCGPCPHTEPCSQKSHVCSESASAETIAQAILAFINGNWSELKRQAVHDVRVRFLRTRHLECGFWFAENLKAPTNQRLVEDILERSACKFWLNREHQHELAAYGTESVRLQSDLQTLWQPEGGRPLLAHLDFLDSDLTTDVSASRNQQAKEVGGVVQLSPLRDADDVKHKNGIKKKLVRSLKSRLMESI